MHRSTIQSPPPDRTPESAAPAIHGYILAGGRSSRMGTDKALLSFGSTTLLDRAVTTLHHAAASITLVGRAYATPLATRSILDHVSHAGPVAGVEAAITDLAARNGTWALFLPVDVPLLPGALLRALTDLWRSSPNTRIAFPVVDDIAQPVISLVHVDALPTIRGALALDQRRLRPTLEQAAQHLAEQLSAPLADVLRTPHLIVKGSEVHADTHTLAWSPSPDELNLAHLWFANANTPQELDRLRNAAQLS